MMALQNPASPGSDVHFSSWRLDGLGEPPLQLTLENLPPLDMMDSTSSKRNSLPSPNLLNGPSTPLTDASAARINTPTRIPRSQNSLSRRAISGNHELSVHTTSTARAGSEAPSEGAGDTSPWSGAVGKASLGKSGRVIERLMAERDQLKRELNAEILHRQEVEKRDDLNKKTIDTLKAERENLLQAQEIDAAALKRRDRKIEELKADVEAERLKRLRAEEMARDACANRDEVVATSNREIGEAREVAKHATSHADVLEQSHKQLGTEYRQRTETFANDLQKLAEARDEERLKVKKLDAVVKRLEVEVDRTSKINEKMGETFTAYKEAAEGQIQDLKVSARQYEERDAALRAESERVVGEARHLINLTKNARERDERTRVKNDV